MTGPLALVGSGEFTPAMVGVDTELLRRSGRPRPRVAIIPTASWPDGEAVFRGWADRGIAHFSALGAEAAAVAIRDADDARDAGLAATLADSDLVYLSGGKPHHLLASLAGSPAWRAIEGARERGAVLAGSSAGAMVLAGRLFGLRDGKLPLPVHWGDALGTVPGTAVIPHYDAFPEAIAAALVLAAPRGLVVLGIDEDTALIGGDGSWHVRGRGRVTVWRGRDRARFRDGSRVDL